MLLEMALSKSDAIDRCINLGIPFIEHYHKIYLDKNSPSKEHWMTEMQSWLDKVRLITLKKSNKGLLDGELRDWFFTAGSNPEEIVKDMSIQELEDYDKFCTKLLSNKELQIKDIL